MLSVAKVLRDNKEEYARLMTEEMGKVYPTGYRRSRKVCLGL